MNKIFYFAIILLSVRCKNNEAQRESEQLICTLQYVTYTVELSTEPLTNFYTLYVATQDTIRFEDYNSSDRFYPILDDRFTAELIDKKEDFIFVGQVGNEQLRIPYVFTSDRCHIVKVSGPDRYPENSP